MQDQAAPNFGVAGQVVLISGGTGGIGMAFARAFAACGAIPILADLKPPAEATPFRDEPLDVLIHRAGRLVRHEEHQAEVFRDIVDIHLVGNMSLATAFRPHLARRRGCLINIGSMYSYFGAAMIPAFAAAKTAIIGLRNPWPSPRPRLASA